MIIFKQPNGRIFDSQTGSIDDFDDDKFEAALKNSNFSEEDLIGLPPIQEDWDDEDDLF